MIKNKIKLKKGDEVIVITGKDKGKKGKIVRVIPDIRKVIVSDVNKYKKHQKPGNNEPGGIIEKDMPIHISNVAFFDAQLNKGVRVGFSSNKDGKKINPVNFYYNDLNAEEYERMIEISSQSNQSFD